MCGACGSGRTSGADAVLNTAYGRAVVSRLSRTVAPDLVVRALSAGWSIGRLGRAMVACRTAGQLVRAIGARLTDGVEVSAVAARIRAAEPHRPLSTNRAAFPAGAVIDAAAESALRPDRVIHGVLAAALGAALAEQRGIASADPLVTLADEHGAWRLRC